MRISFFAFILPVVAAVVQAATIHVPADQPTIQAGIDTAKNGDTVLVAPGTHRGEGNVNLSINRKFGGEKNLVITGEWGTDSTIIDGEGVSDGFAFKHTLEDSTTVIRGLTLVNMVSGIYSSSASPVLEQLAFVDCDVAMDLHTSSMVSIVECDFLSNNTGVLCGAAPVLCRDCSFVGSGTAVLTEFEGCLTLDSCFFAGNGVAAAGQFTMSNCRVTGGGGVNPYWTSTVRICDSEFSGVAGFVLGLHGQSRVVERCWIHDNPGDVAHMEGGDGQSDYLRLDNCVIESNGGGIWNNSYDVSLVMDSCLYMNTGGVKVRGGRAIITNSTFANLHGVGVHLVYPFADSFGESYISNNIIAVSDEAGIQVSSHPEAQWQLNVSCSDIYGNAGGNYVGIPDQTSLNGNISADPLFCDTANGDFSLQASSPCSADSNTCGQIGALPVGCFSHCCLSRGDVDQSGGIPDISDLIYLVAYVYLIGPEFPCMEESDINGDGDGPDMSDVVAAVNYMFGGCPECMVPCP